MPKNKGGRPTKMTPETVKKLEEAFALGCTDIEACLFADISKQTLYNYQDKNPKFIDRKEALKENPVLEARKSVVTGMKDDPKLAFDYLKNKKSDEFASKQKTEHSGSLVADILGDIDGKSKGLPED